MARRKKQVYLGSETWKANQLISFIKNLNLLNENSEWENYNIETNIEKINYVKHKEEMVSSLYLRVLR